MKIAEIRCIYLRRAQILAFGLMVGLLVSACSQNPVRGLFQLADQHQLPSYRITGNGQEMWVFEHPLLAQTSRSALRVYLEGDGNPWYRGVKAAKNPTSRNPVALRLMLLDPTPAIYLNRPCYGFEKIPSSCSAQSWTSGRYSAAILSSMSAALDTLKKTHGASEIVLIGYSGGASIAAILAAQRDDVSVLVTLSGNLDHRAWTDYFGYLPLESSMNAADFFPLPPRIQRWHHFARKDKIVPSPLTERAALQDFGAQFILHENFDHSCCWEDGWRDQLKSMGL